MWLAIVTLMVLLIIVILVCLNLLKKVEKYEEDIILKDDYIEQFSELLLQSSKAIEAADLKGSFETDDEIGVFFENIKKIQLLLSGYKINYKD